MACTAGCHSAARQRDPPLLVPWNRIGDIALGESKTRVQHEYGPQRGFHLLPTARRQSVWVTFDTGRVSAFGFDTPYYRTKSGFGVSSTIPLGPCHRTPTERGAQSLPVTGKNFLKPWFFINIKYGRVEYFYFDSKFID